MPWGTTPISVLKPVRGVDDELEANLESFCRQTHRRYEIIVGAADPDDPALVVARRVRSRHPGLAFRVVTGEWPTGHNPKVRNLRNLLAHARYPTILVSDADIRAEPDYLSVMAGAIEQPNVGLVSNLIVGAGDLTLGSACENAQLNGFVAATTAAASMIARHPVVVGKSMLFRRDALTNVGGLAAAADVLAEDYLLGRAVVAAGYRVTMVGYPVRAIARNWGLMRTLKRHARWAQIRRHVAPLVFMLEPLAYPSLWGALLALVWLAGVGTSEPGAALAGTSAVALAMASILVQYFVCLRLRGEPPRALALPAMLFTPVLALVAWMRAWMDDVVVWRQQYFRVGRGSQLRLLTPTALHQQQRFSQAA